MELKLAYIKFFLASHMIPVKIHMYINKNVYDLCEILVIKKKSS